jgi:hypothetical protein
MDPEAVAVEIENASLVEVTLASDAILGLDPGRS